MESYMCMLSKRHDLVADDIVMDLADINTTRVGPPITVRDIALGMRRYLEVAGHPVQSPATTELDAAQLAAKAGRLVRFQKSLKSGHDKYDPKTSFDLIRGMSGIPHVVERLGKHLDSDELINLYSVSRDFHSVLNGNLTSCIKAWAQGPDGDMSALDQRQFNELHINDPAGELASEYKPELVNPGKDNVRLVPSLRWYDMASSRERIVKEIVAHLARAGLRTPKGTDKALLKIWVMMELPTTKERFFTVQNEDWMTIPDLVNAHIFFVKLALLFSDPIYDCSTKCALHDLFLGQRGLFPLWQMLMGHRYRTMAELVKLKVAYDYDPDWEAEGCNIFGVPGHLVGRGHIEGWGEDPEAIEVLALPTEIVAAELIRRKMDLRTHIIHHILWGHIDHATGANLCPSEEEIYMENADHANRSVDVSAEFQPIHCRKARWFSLSIAERDDVEDAEYHMLWYLHQFNSPDIPFYMTDEDFFDDIPDILTSQNIQNTDQTAAEDAKRLGNRRFYGHWEMNMNSRVRRLASLLQSSSLQSTPRDNPLPTASAGIDQCIEYPRFHRSAQIDSTTVAAAHLIPNRSMGSFTCITPETQTPGRTGRYAFPTTLDDDDPMSRHPFQHPIREDQAIVLPNIYDEWTAELPNILSMLPRDNNGNGE